MTGPFKINGVPLRRVNARYVIATSTKVDLKGVDSKALEKVSGESYFAREKKSKKEKGEEAFTKQGEKSEVCFHLTSLHEEGCFLKSSQTNVFNRRSSLPQSARQTRSRSTSPSSLPSRTRSSSPAISLPASASDTARDRMR